MTHTDLPPPVLVHLFFIHKNILPQLVSLNNGICQTPSTILGGWRVWQSQEAGSILVTFRRRPRVNGVSYRPNLTCGQMTSHFVDSEYGGLSSQSCWKAVHRLPTTVSESARPMVSGGSDGDVPMIDLLDRPPPSFRLSGDTDNGATRSTTEGRGESEICFGAVRYITTSDTVLAKFF
jgi:hypothetical protein